MTAVLGVGVDLVDVDAFMAQLQQPGSRFVEVFSAAERRAAQARGASTGRGFGYHLAARWAVKEAVVKAWSQACFGAAPVVGEGEAWRLVEVVADRWGRVGVDARGALRVWLDERCARVHVSLSHDGGWAVAMAVLAGAGEEAEV